MKRLTAILLTLITIFSFSAVFAAGDYDYTPDMSEYSASFAKRWEARSDYENEADALNYLGLFKGSDSGYELSRMPTRIEALITVIRLIGCEQEALDRNISPTFRDVPAWATAYAGYGQQNNIVQGIGDGRLGSNDPVSAPQYLTMLLRVLGYNDSSGDFAYENALSFAESIGLITSRDTAYFQKNSKMIRGDMAYFMNRALSRAKKGGDLLILDLVKSGAVSEGNAYGTMRDKGESAAEIHRALSNGYREAWLEQLNASIKNNSKISDIFAPIFKQSMYNWLKEPGGGSNIAQVKHNLAKLTTNIVRPLADEIFKDPTVMAYFMYPNQIVVRSDIDIGFESNAFAHEFRHAMSGNMGLLTLEEGLTELFIQEADDGQYGYPYYFVNTAKLFTHLIGAERMNEIVYSGNYEDIFYDLETVTGTRIADKSGFRAIVFNISELAARDESYKTFSKEMSALIYAYYMKNNAALIKKPGGYPRYIDTMISLEQLMYFPSAMVRDAETTLNSNLPSSYYSPDFEKYISAILADRAAKTGENAAELENYYQANRDTRYCQKYFGPDAGKLMVKNSFATRLIYKYRDTYYDKVFGQPNEAAAFAGKVSITKTETIPDAGFSAKVY